MIPSREIEQLLRAANNIVITAHKSPDGDAVGSTLGLYHALSEAGKKCTVVLPDPFARFLNWMPGSEEILIHEKQKENAEAAIRVADLVFCLDYNSLDRTGDLAPVLAASQAPRILIDHHPFPADEFTVRFSDTIFSSTCEMVVELLLSLDMKKHITRNSATCLYTGLVTDTGSFRYSCTTVRTHEIAGVLLQTGIENAKIHNQLFDTNREGRLKLLGYALSEKMMVDRKNKTAWFALTGAELERFGHQKGDTEGLVNYGLSLEGISIAALFVEHPDKIKISIRSKEKVPVNEIARAHFSGGGHTNAAGGMWDGDLKSALDKWKAVYPEFMEKYV